MTKAAEKRNSGASWLNTVMMKLQEKKPQCNWLKREDASMEAQSMRLVKAYVENEGMNKAERG